MGLGQVGRSGGSGVKRLADELAGDQLWQLENDFMRMNSEDNDARPLRAVGKTRLGLLGCLALALGLALIALAAGCHSPQNSIDEMLDSGALPPKAATMDYATNLLHEGD